MRTILIAVLLAAPIAVVPPSNAEADAAVPVAAAGFSFASPVVVVPLGVAVEWRRVALLHTVTTTTALDGPPNDPVNADGDPDTFHAPLSGSPTFTHTFTRPGVYTYRCNLHFDLGMVGAVVVVGPSEPAFAVAPFAPVAAPTAIEFGPDGDLYATTLAGEVVRVDVTWTPAGPVAGAPTTVASGFSQPLGLAFDGGAILVSDSRLGAESGRTDGYIARIDGATRSVVVDGLPNGRHNTNHMRWGPDGRLYVANGNPNDNGLDGGDPDVFPYSGAILSIDPAEVAASPAVLRWRNGTTPIPPDEVAGHPLNADFASKVRVLARGFRNVFGVAFAPDGTAYTAMNGADSPSSQDALFRIQPGADYGFPFCYDEGPSPGLQVLGDTGAIHPGTDVSVVANPTFPGHDCSGVPAATALLGWHVCATGIDVPPAGSPFGNAAYVGECTQLFPEPDKGFGTGDTSHKVARVRLDANGEAIAVEDFLVGFALVTDVRFGPDGALYVADAGGIHRVSAVV